MAWFKKRDLYIIAGVLFLAVLLYAVLFLFSEKKEVQAEIYYGSRLVCIKPLVKGEEYRFQIEEQKKVWFHVYEDGSICFEESNCPDHICIKSGRLRYAGQSAACLPNKLVLKIVAKEKDTDAVDIAVPVR